MVQLRSINLRIADRLKDREFRREWYLAELEQGVPEQFKALREERKMTQTALADATGMKQSAISRFEKSADAKWKFETLLTMADALDAQLRITLVRSEVVIEEAERRDKARENAASDASVIKALAEAHQRQQRDPQEKSGSSAMEPEPPPPSALRNLLKNEGNRPWK